MYIRAQFAVGSFVVISSVHDLSDWWTSIVLNTWWGMYICEYVDQSCLFSKQYDFCFFFGTEWFAWFASVCLGIIMLVTINNV